MSVNTSRGFLGPGASCLGRSWSFLLQAAKRNVYLTHKIIRSVSVGGLPPSHLGTPYKRSDKGTQFNKPNLTTGPLHNVPNYLHMIGLLVNTNATLSGFNFRIPNLQTIKSAFDRPEKVGILFNVAFWDICIIYIIYTTVVPSGVPYCANNPVLKGYVGSGVYEARLFKLFGGFSSARDQDVRTSLVISGSCSILVK